MQNITLVLLVALCGLAAVATAAPGEGREPPPDMKEKFDACLKDLGKTKEDMKDKDVKNKVQLCVLKKKGVITADGKFAPDAIIEHMSSNPKMTPAMLEKAKKKIEQCATEIESDSGLKEEALAEKITMLCFEKLDD